MTDKLPAALREALDASTGDGQWDVFDRWVRIERARAMAAALRWAVTRMEEQRQLILSDPTDPSWTEHLAEVQGDLRLRIAALEQEAGSS